MAPEDVVELDDRTATGNAAEQTSQTPRAGRLGTGGLAEQNPPKRVQARRRSTKPRRREVSRPVGPIGPSGVPRALGTFQGRCGNWQCGSPRAEQRTGAMTHVCCLTTISEARGPLFFTLPFQGEGRPPSVSEGGRGGVNFGANISPHPARSSLRPTLRGGWSAGSSPCSRAARDDRRRTRALVTARAIYASVTVSKPAGSTISSNSQSSE